MLVVYPIFQILFFSYLGRVRRRRVDTFFLIGNAFIAAAITGLFGMGQAIGGERRFQTLPVLLASPANRLALFLGPAVPTILIGFLVATIAFVFGAAILGCALRRRARSAASPSRCSRAASPAPALGLCIGSLGLRGRARSRPVRRHDRRRAADRLRSERSARPAAGRGADARRLRPAHARASTPPAPSPTATRSARPSTRSAPSCSSASSTSRSASRCFATSRATAGAPDPSIDSEAWPSPGHSGQARQA